MSMSFNGLRRVQVPITATVSSLAIWTGRQSTVKPPAVHAIADGGRARAGRLTGERRAEHRFVRRALIIDATGSEEPMTDTSVDLGRIRLKNPIICASSEFTMTPGGIRAALKAGAGAVIAKSVNEAPGAARQLDIAQYLLLESGWTAAAWEQAGLEASLFCRSGLAQAPLDQWLEMLAQADREARAYDAYV